jgi:hypothetical protein
VIDVVPAADIDRLEALWRELLSHHVGVLETLVVSGDARGEHVGLALLNAARERLADGNAGALRFYRREGASDYLHTLIIPVTQAPTPE